jgi:hypothetical protein
MANQEKIAVRTTDADADAEQQRADDLREAKDLATQKAAESRTQAEEAQGARDTALASVDAAEAVAADIGALGGVGGTVSTSGDLPDPGPRSGEWWYVVDDTDYYTSDGSSWSQTGTGIISRDDLNRRYFDAAAYGAIGDGSVDDTAAIQAAIDAVQADGGGTVYLPRGTYRITDRLLIDAHYVHLRGAGRGATTLKVEDVGGDWTGFELDPNDSIPDKKAAVVFSSVSGGSVEGVGVDGSGFTYTEDSQEDACGVLVHDSTQVDVVSCRVTDVFPSHWSTFGGENDGAQLRYNGIIFMKSKGCAARYCRVDNIKYDGITARVGNDSITFEGNWVSQCFECFQCTQRYGQAEPEDPAEKYNRHIRIIANYAVASRNDAGAITLHSAHSIVQGNTCYGSTDGSAAIELRRNSEYVTVTANTITNPEADHAQLETNDNQGIEINACSRITITGNAISYVNTAILLDGPAVDYIQVFNNTVRWINEGINHNAGSVPSLDLIATANIIHNAARRGIIVQGEEVRLTDNIIYGLRESGSVGIDIKPSWEGGMEDLEIKGNYVKRMDTPWVGLYPYGYRTVGIIQGPYSVRSSSVPSDGSWTLVDGLDSMALRPGGVNSQLRTGMGMIRVEGFSPGDTITIQIADPGRDILLTETVYEVPAGSNGSEFVKLDGPIKGESKDVQFWAVHVKSDTSSGSALVDPYKSTVEIVENLNDAELSEVRY